MTARHAAASAVEVRTDDEAATRDLAEDVAVTLAATPRSLSPRHLYDPLGSALFDAICRLPWYRITRAEVALLERRGREILDVGPAADVVELGPGNGEKLMTLLRSASPDRRTSVHLIDISPAALEDASHKLRTLPNVSVSGHAARYAPGLQAHRDSSPDAHRLVLFLGSNIGNSEPEAADQLLADFRAAMAPGDTLLIGTDLVKPERDLLLAYDDPLGVTAAFSRNVLVRLNRELGADFELSRFAHRATWNAARSRVEIRLVSLADQRIRVPGAGLEFRMARDETIWTENSYKFEPAGVEAMLRRAGFRTRAQWIDHDARFALTLAGAE